jgi:uncharacterized ferredoxin-like protein
MILKIIKGELNDSEDEKIDASCRAKGVNDKKITFADDEENKELTDVERMNEQKRLAIFKKENKRWYDL